jgi:hypothetical protein
MRGFTAHRCLGQDTSTSNRASPGLLTCGIPNGPRTVSLTPTRESGCRTADWALKSPPTTSSACTRAYSTASDSAYLFVSVVTADRRIFEFSSNKHSSFVAESPRTFCAMDAKVRSVESLSFCRMHDAREAEITRVGSSLDHRPRHPVASHFYERLPSFEAKMARVKLPSRITDPSLKPACSLSERINTHQSNKKRTEGCAAY